MDRTIKKSTYYYDLPEELIAQTPIEPRDHSRLLVYDKSTMQIEHKHFYDIIDYLNAGDILVVNNTKVLPARLYGEKENTGAKIEILLLKKLKLDEWEILIKPAKRVKIGTMVVFSPKLTGIVKEKLENGNVIMNFEVNGVFEAVIHEIGVMPLPHYIKKELEKKNENRYQTVYAKTDGSSAAPTAGLHFTSELLEKIKNRGIQIVEVTLNVGLGTFRPVSEDNILKHEMHTEYYEITKESAEIINRAKREGRRVIAVGTTSVRVLESASTNSGIIEEHSGDTNIFIYPGYKFKIVDCLITNFHLPESTLIMLVSAMCGIDETLALYRKAVEERYRFFSFGDATFIK
ncbi:MAG: tRNA preQ1(34) S-adenosylmethionine ribosyltransferase-isomerase QueA [Spirochaetales bacterium]